MSEHKYLDQLNDRDWSLLEKIKSDFLEQTGKDFYLEIENLDLILTHYESTLEKIPNSKKITQRDRVFNWVKVKYYTVEKKVWASDEDKNNAINRTKLKHKIGLVKWLKVEREKELLKSSLIPVSQNGVKKISKGKNDNYGKVQQRLLDLIKKDNIRIEECDKIPSPKLNKFGLIIEKEGLTKNKKPYKNERSRISSIRKILSDIREKEKLLLKKDKT